MFILCLFAYPLAFLCASKSFSAIHQGISYEERAELVMGAMIDGKGMSDKKVIECSRMGTSSLLIQTEPRR